MFAWLLFILVVSICNGYKVLITFPAPSPSHNILGEGVVKPLLDAGHEVTYATVYPTMNPHPRLHLIDLSANDKAKPSQFFNLTSILDKENSFSDLQVVFNMMNVVNTETFKNPNFVTILQDPNQNFDVVISEWMFTDQYAGLGAVFNCPFMWMSPLEPHWLVLNTIDDYTNPAYVPGPLSQNEPPFTFVERVQELFIMIVELAAKFFFMNRIAQNNYDAYLAPAIRLRGREPPPYETVKYNASLMLSSSHVSFGFANRLPQNFIPVGGYHIEPEVKPLPDDLKKLLHDAKDGLIYFSMGSNLKSKELPDSMKKDFLRLFSGLKQKVLWKFEEQLPDLPENVHIVSWAPQQSILAHPNCIFFITHGGMLSTTEAIHFEKPIIGIPVFGDQLNNIVRAVKKGFALKVDLSFNLIQDLEEAIKETMSNKRYAERARELSVIYHDRPVSPRKELVHWVEHVVRTRGALHLRSPALHMPFYQKMYLDLAALVIAIIYVLKITIKRLCYPKKKIIVKKKNN